MPRESHSDNLIDSMPSKYVVLYNILIIVGVAFAVILIFLMPTKERINTQMTVLAENNIAFFEVSAYDANRSRKICNDSLYFEYNNIEYGAKIMDYYYNLETKTNLYFISIEGLNIDTEYEKISIYIELGNTNWGELLFKLK
ncbi:MAG: hypothetical protein R3Y59_07990 [bacterium]